MALAFKIESTLSAWTYDSSSSFSATVIRPSWCFVRSAHIRFLSLVRIPRSRINRAPSGGTRPPLDSSALLNTVAPVVFAEPGSSRMAFLLTFVMTPFYHGP